MRTAYATMIDSVRRRMGDDVEIWGVLIQKMLERGKEVILGVTRDQRFGPVLMFGLGGIYTETFRDVAFRLAPIRENVARRDDPRHPRRSSCCEGVRGEPPSDLAAVAECLLRLSQFVTEHPQDQRTGHQPAAGLPARQRRDGRRCADHSRRDDARHQVRQRRLIGLFTTFRPVRTGVSHHDNGLARDWQTRSSRPSGHQAHPAGQPRVHRLGLRRAAGTGPGPGRDRRAARRTPRC